MTDNFITKILQNFTHFGNDDKMGLMTLGRILKRYSFLIGILLFVFILSRLDFGYYKTLIGEISLSGILAVLASIFFLFLPNMALCPLRWRYLMKLQGIHYSFWESFLMYQASVYVGLFTPGRAGEISRVFYLKKEHSAGRAFVSIILDRVIDIVFLLVFGYMAMFLFLDILKKEVLIFGVAVLVLLFLIILIWKNKYFLKKIFYYFVSAKYRDLWKLNFQDFFRDLRIYGLRNYIFPFFLTLINWSVYYLVIYLFAREIGIVQIPVFYFFCSLAVVSLVSILPISIAGLGTRDAVLLTMFSLFGVPAELTIAVSMFILFLSFVIAPVGLFCWLKKPIEL